VCGARFIPLRQSIYILQYILYYLKIMCSSTDYLWREYKPRNRTASIYIDTPHQERRRHNRINTAPYSGYSCHTEWLLAQLYAFQYFIFSSVGGMKNAFCPVNIRIVPAATDRITTSHRIHNNTRHDDNENLEIVPRLTAVSKVPTIEIGTGRVGASAAIFIHYTRLPIM